MAPSSDPPPWSDLPYHVLSLVIDRLGSSSSPELPDDQEQDSAAFRAVYSSALGRARFRAVCRSWRAAVREHPPRRMPWTILTDGSFITGSDAACRRIPSCPENATCIDSTGSWLALECDDLKHRSYLLHDPFSGTTVRLPELDALIGGSSCIFEVRKVLMRSSSSSSPSDDLVLVALLTNNYNYPVILLRPGKGLWLPRPRSAPFIYITDIVFAGDDKLYGITMAEDLISLDIGFDADDGKPTVTATRRVIRHATRRGYISNVWSDVDYIRVQNHLSPLDDGSGLWSDVEERYCQEDDAEDDDETLPEEDDDDRARYEIRKNTGDDTINHTIHVDLDHGDEIIATTWHIVESLGKLLMVRRKLQWLPDGVNSTLGADVLEANITTVTWMPVTAGLDGHALFISGFNCKSIHACGGELQRDAVYFVDTAEVFNIKSRIISKPQRDLLYMTTMWIFPPEIVV